MTRVTWRCAVCGKILHFACTFGERARDQAAAALIEAPCQSRRCAGALRRVIITTTQIGAHP